MKYGRYIKEHAVWLAIFGGLLFTIETFLLTLQDSLWLAVYIAVAMTICFFLGTYIEYRKTKRYFEQMEITLDNIDKKYLIGEMVAFGGSQEMRENAKILHAMGADMNDKVAEYRRKSEDYKEYIETWVHEVKIPLSVMQMILTNHGKDPLAECGMETEVDRVATYVEQALFYARSAEVEKDYFIKQVNLEQIVKDAIVQRKRMLIARKASVNIHDMQTKKIALSDGKWLTFIIGQILDNSIKYAKENGLCLELFCEEKENQIHLHIKDDGIGMKVGERERAFEKGFTGSNGRSNKASTGIGLYLCKKLCTRLEHDITLSSEEGVGTDVVIIL